MKARDLIIIPIVFALLLAAAPRVYSRLCCGAELRRELTLLRTETGELLTLSAADYVKGCLLAQIPINYGTEALKAQAVCAYTYALKFISENEKADISKVGEADISDSPSLCQPYFSEAEARELYGGDYDVYEDAVNTAAEYGASHVITYGGELIYSVYHSVSAGKTCSSEAVWGITLPYLVPVSSPWDMEYHDLLCKNEMTVETARQRLIASYPDITVPADYAKWFSSPNADEQGYITEITLGSMTLTGGDLWRTFGLRSTALEVSYQSGIFTFTTRGYGHGAGMSQYGANALAEKGYTAEAILLWYFSGAEVK